MITVCISCSATRRHSVDGRAPREPGGRARSRARGLARCPRRAVDGPACPAGTRRHALGSVVPIAAGLRRRRQLQRPHGSGAVDRAALPKQLAAVAYQPLTPALGYRPRLMAAKIVLLPGDGIGPEIIAPAVEVLDAVGAELRLRGAPLRRRVDRRPRHRADRRDARRLPRGRRGAARGRRRPEVGHDRPGQAASRAGPARAAQGARPVRQPASGAAAAGAVRREPAEARGDRGNRPAGRARADRRDLLRREDAHGGLRLRRVRVHARGDRAHRAGRVRRRALARDERRQGQRARDQPPVARGRPRRSTDASSPTSSSSTCSSTTPRCGWSRRRATST